MSVIGTGAAPGDATLEPQSFVPVAVKGATSLRGLVASFTSQDRNQAIVTARVLHLADLVTEQTLPLNHAAFVPGQPPEAVVALAKELGIEPHEVGSAIYQAFVSHTTAQA